jgi:branched-chain amino acid aminotransferase
MLIMDMPISQQELQNVIVELIQKEGHRQDVYIRPMAYFADEIIGVKLHDLQTELTVFSVPFSKYVDNDTGAHVTFSSWRRVDDNMIPARAKVAGAYVNTAFIKTDAVRAGFDEALVLTADGHISEGSAENIFMLREGVLYTPPITDNILEGITRRSVIELAKDMGLDVVPRSIDRTEVFICDELFMTGTAAQVTAITKVDHRPVADGKMGPVTAKLRKMYDDAVRGRLPKFRHWNHPVYEKIMVKS